MIVYLFTSTALFLLFLLELKSTSAKKIAYIFYIGAFLVFFILAFRSELVGGDTLNYCRFFEGKSSMYGTYKKLDEAISHEVGFLYTVRFFRLFGSSAFTFLFCSSLLTLAPFFYIVKRDCTMKILPLCLYMLLFGILAVTQSAIRQIFGVAYIMLGYIFYTSNIKKYKLPLTIFFLLLACFCHTYIVVSLAIMIPCYFLKINRIWGIILILTSVAISILEIQLFSSFFSFSESWVSELELLSRWNGYYENVQFELDEERISLFRLLPTSLFACLLIWQNDDKEKHSFPFNCLVVGTCLYNLGLSFPMMFRVMYPLLFMGITTSPGNLRLPALKLQKAFIIIMLLLFMQRQYEHLSNYDYTKNESKMLPYTFIFE